MAEPQVIWPPYQTDGQVFTTGEDFFFSNEGRNFHIIGITGNGNTGSVAVFGRMNSQTGWSDVRWWEFDPATQTTTGPFVGPMSVTNGTKLFYVVDPYRLFKVVKTHGIATGTMGVDYEPLNRAVDFLPGIDSDEAIDSGGGGGSDGGGGSEPGPDDGDPGTSPTNPIYVEVVGGDTIVDFVGPNGAMSDGVPQLIEGKVETELLPSEEHIGNVGGFTGDISWVLFTRPANTTQYSAGDVVGPAATAILRFPNMARIKGGSGYITKGLLELTQTTDTTTYRLYILNQPIAGIADNAAWTLLEGDWFKRIGFIDFVAMKTEGTGSTIAISQNIVDRLPFKCAPDTVDLYGVLVAQATPTPDSGERYRIGLTPEQN